MSRVDDWAKGKPKHIALIAQQLASLTEDGFRLLSLDISKLIKSFNLSINTDSWIALYSRQDEMIHLVGESLSRQGEGFYASYGEYLKHLSETYEALPDGPVSIESVFFKNLPPDSPAFTKFASTAYQRSIESIDSFNSRENESAIFSDNIFNLPYRTEFVFLLTVLGPSMFFYGENPLSLLNNARSGDIDALDKLLRIDKLITNDPAIRKQIDNCSLKEDKTDLERIAAALKGKISGKYNLKNAKYKVAGLISIASEYLGEKLSAPEIKDLFDAIAIDRGQDEQIDPDLPDSPEAFSKAIQRDRSFWLATIS